MRAVNLLPAQPRTQALGLSVSPALGGVIGGLCLVLAGTGAYVLEHNRVNSRKADLAELSIGVAHWSATADTYSRFTADAQQRAQETASVRQLIASRYDWENLLSEIAGLLPRTVQLSSLTATSPVSLASTSTATSTTGNTSSALQIAGCATSQYAVANAMVRLQRVTGVSKVLLSTSQRLKPTQTCTLPVQFALSLDFASSVSPGSPSATSTTPVTPATSTGVTDSEAGAS